MVQQVFPERTIYHESQLAGSVRDKCPSRRPMRLGARHRRLLATAGPCRPRCVLVRLLPPLRHHVIQWGQKGGVAFPSSRYWRRSELIAHGAVGETSWNVLERVTYVHRSRNRRGERTARKGKGTEHPATKVGKGRVDFPKGRWRKRNRQQSSTAEIVNRSSTVHALRDSGGVCFSVKDGVHSGPFCDPTAVLVCPRAEGLPLSQALTQLAFRSQKLLLRRTLTESIHGSIHGGLQRSPPGGISSLETDHARSCESR
jgi:hypothetical protein